MNDKDKTGTGSKNSGPSTILVLIVAALVVIAVWSSRHKKEDKAPVSQGTEPAKGPSVGSVDAEIRDLGKVLGIGKGVSAHKPKGTNIVGIDSIKGLSEALEGRDVDAVAKLVEKAGVKHVLVDPSIARRNPIPKNTVKNRLALARPAGRFSAKVMSKNLFLYKLGKPPLDLPDKIKKSLMTIARAAFEKREVADRDKPSFPSENGEWTMILTVRPVQDRHL